MAIGQSGNDKNGNNIAQLMGRAIAKQVFHSSRQKDVVHDILAGMIEEYAQLASITDREYRQVIEETFDVLAKGFFISRIQ